MIKIKFFNDESMDYRFLKAFLAVAKHLSFTRASEELHITQAAVSRQIKLLEESLKTQLLIRSPQKVMLTARGTELYQKANYFNEWVLSEFLSSQYRGIKIGALQGVLENWLITKTEKLYKNKNFNLYIQMSSPSNLLQMMEEGKLDLILHAQNIQTETLSSRRLFKEEIILISQRKISLNKIDHYRWIICDPKDYLMNYSRKKSKEIIQVNSTNAQVRLVEDGMGIAIIPSHFLKNKKKLFIYPIEKFKNEFIYLTTYNFKFIPQHIKEFITILET